MEKLRYLLATFLTLTFFASYQVSATTLKLAYSDVESYPFQIGNSSEISDPPGLSLDIIDQAFRRLGVDIEYVRLPGRRVLEYIKSGQVDGGFIFSYNSKSAQYAVYPLKENRPDTSKRIATLGYYFYKLKYQTFDWDGSSLSAIKDKKVGTHLGFSITRKLKESHIDVLEVKKTAQLFRILTTRHVDIIAIQDTLAQAYLKDKPWASDVERVQPAITEKDYFLIFSREFTLSNPELVEQAWSVIADIRDVVIEKESAKYLDHITLPIL